MHIKRGIIFALFVNQLTVSFAWDFPYLYGYLGTIFDMGLTQEVVWFVSNRLDAMQQGNAARFIKGVSDLGKVSQYVWTNRTDVRLVKIGSKRVSLSVVITTGAEDPVMNMHDRLLIGRHFNFGLIIYPHKVDNMSSIEELCLLLHRENFVNSMVLMVGAIFSPLSNFHNSI